jgi:hypothetical protein
MDIKAIDWSKLDEGGAVVRYIHRNWNRGLLTMAKFIGLSGMGKSYASIRCAELLAKSIHGDNYKIDKRNIIKNLLQMIRFIRSVNTRGEIMIIEEMSVLFPSRRSMSGINVDANAIIDTVRKKGIIMLCNYPLNHTVDSHIEAMCCLEVVAVQLNKTAGICLCRPFILQTNPQIPKTYYHKLIDSEGNEVDSIFFRLPSKELINPYENEKDNLMEKLYETLEAKEHKRQELMDKSLGKISKTGGLKDLTKRQLEIYNLMFLQKKKMTDVALELGVKPQTINSALQVIKMKLEKDEKDNNLMPLVAK